MALRRLVLFIVEGESDELALGRSLTTVFSRRKQLKVQFGIVRGDITAEPDGSPADIKKRVGDCARQYLSKYKLKWSDLDAIVLVSDTDGAFVDASAVVESPSCKKIEYLHDRIICSNAHGIIERNKRKSGCLKVLSRTGSLSYSRKKVRLPLATCRGISSMRFLIMLATLLWSINVSLRANLRGYMDWTIALSSSF